MNPVDVLLPNHAAMHAAAERLVALPSVEPLQILQDRIWSWQTVTFPIQTHDAKIAHLIQEAGELRNAPRDLSEWADVLILFLGAAALQQINAAQLIESAHCKMDINERRQWSKPDAQGVYHHLHSETEQQD